MRLRLALLGSVLLLSGCASDPTPAMSLAEPSAPATVAAGPAFDGSASIRVAVVDDAQRPIEGSTVGLAELFLDATTDQDGVAVFTGLIEGRYRIAAAKLGYAPETRLVDVGFGGEAAVVMELAAVVANERYHETFGPLRGYFDCRHAFYVPQYTSWTSSCGTVCTTVREVGCLGLSEELSTLLFPNDNAVLRFRLSSAQVASVVGELGWVRSSAGAASALRIAFSHDARTPGHWWCAGEGESVLRFRWERSGPSQCTDLGASGSDPVPLPDLALRMYVNTPFGRPEAPARVAMQQRFDLLSTVFYGAPAPRGFEGLEGS